MEPLPDNSHLIGCVVRWRSQRTEGHGQIIDPDRDGRVVIRTWLPCPTKEVAVERRNLTVIATPARLAQLLTFLATGR